MLSELNDYIAKNLFSLASTEDLYNLYSTLDPDLDLPDALDIRRSNLRAYVENRPIIPEVLLLTEAPGPWGCRFSGVPITSEYQLLDPAFPLDGFQSSNAPTPHKEYSASIYWRILKPFYWKIFTWNTVPLHPHHAGRAMSIRTPRMSEIKCFLPLVEGIIKILSPRAIIAVGRKAQKALLILDIDAVYVRHPSQGGATLFEHGVRSVLTEQGHEA